MINWADPKYLYFLLALPAVLGGYLAGFLLSRRRLARFADDPLIPRLTDSRHGGLWWLKNFLFILGLGFLIIGLARPRWGEKLQIYKGRGIDVIIALDASKSMLAQDIKPSRLERAKVELSQILESLAGNRAGIVAFAGEAHVMCPLTSDVEAAKLFLDIIDPLAMPRPGTNIQRALEVSASLFTPQEEGSRAVILITDGDNLEGDPLAAAKMLKDLGARLYIVGVGTHEGSTVPETDGGSTFYKKDADDKLVVSRLAERLLLVMARETDGRYYRSEGLSLDNLASELDRLRKKELEGGEFVEREERYQGFLLVSFILLFFSVFISDRRGAWFSFPRLEFKRLKFHFLVVFAGLFLAETAMAGVGAKMRAGNAQMKKGNFQEAHDRYQEALVLEPDNQRIHYNLGRALHKQGKHQEAASEFQLAMLSKNKKLQSRAMYNIGNCAYRQGGLDQAVQAYTMSLLLNPGDLQAKQNLELALKMKDQQKNQSDSTKQNQNQPQPNQQKQQPTPQPQQGQMSRQEAERVLQALQNREKQDLKKQQEKQRKQAKVDKDW
jgi:Ca-activated chloride channel family protein